ncbi:hypothetical protein [Asticcacaulis taihuensis]|uniref:hypothetical protein n=1 Tax=Asticcacaulis taihuensis TaxID=260084 RepID=UPI0026EA05D2|nr:hypothetical protein [Asticcacaulis taihuensis]
MIHATLINSDFETKKLLIRLGLATVIASFLIWLTRTQLKSMRENFAKKWQIDMEDVRLLYASRRRKVGSVLAWSMAAPLFVMGILVIVMAIGANANDIRLMLLMELYACPFAFIMMGLYCLLAPTRDIAWGLRLKSLKPSDFQSHPTRHDFERALKARAPRYYGLRITGLLILGLTGILIWAEITYHAQTWVDTHLPHGTAVTSSATQSVLPVTVKALTPATK